MRRCFICRASGSADPIPIPALRGEDAALVESVCSPACGDRARRFAARRSAQSGTSNAGLLVAALGLVTGAAFRASGRDLGWALVVMALLAAGTTRLAYPDAIPAALVRRLGLAHATELLQWMGVLLVLAALAMGVLVLLGD